MRDYEILYIVRPELDEDHVNQAVERVNALIANVGGEHVKTDVWGKRRLAYEVERLREGYYVLTDFRVEPERVPEMESTLKISDTVFRHLIVRKPAKAVAAPSEAAPAVETSVDGEQPAVSEGGKVEDAETAEVEVAADEAAEAEAEIGVEPDLGELQEEG